MVQQVQDLLDESEGLYTLLSPLSERDFSRPTQFKDWTLHEVTAHLHIFNWAANESIRDGDSFVRWWEGLKSHMATHGKNLREATDDWLDEFEDGLRGRALLDRWISYTRSMAGRLRDVDPRLRVKWAGPDMSVRSSLTARLMETWAHGQEAFDMLGQERHDTDRIRNIAILGINTFGWTFINRGLDVPTDVPHVRLQAPSGATWEWNEPNETNFVAGSATQFCQVVAQTRNIADTQLEVAGASAKHWMKVAQCFAGAPEDPPAPGSRFTA